MNERGRDARAQAREDVVQTLRVLELLISRSKRSLRRIELDLGYSTSTLSRIFSEKMELRAYQVLDLLRYFEIVPAAFFEFVDRSPGLNSDQLLSALLRSPLAGVQPTPTNEVGSMDLEELHSYIRDEVERQLKKNEKR